MEQNTENKDNESERWREGDQAPEIPQAAPDPAPVSEGVPQVESPAATPQAAPDFGGLKADTVKPTREQKPLEELGDLGKLIKALRSARVINANRTTIQHFAVSRLIPFYTINAPGTGDDGAFDLPKFKTDFEGYIDSIKLDIGPIRL